MDSSKSSRKRKRVCPQAVTMSHSELFLKLIAKCKKIDNSSDMEVILTKKIVKYYDLCDDKFKNSSLFLTQLEDLHSKLEKHPEDVFVYINDFHLELKRASKSGPSAKRPKIDVNSSSTEQVIEFNNERQQIQAQKLSKALEKLKKRIKALECEEVQWDSEDESNSSYIQLQRYKERAAKVFEKLCSITKESKLAGRIKNIHFSGTPFPGVNKCIEKYVNSTGEFPDYKDILDVIQRTNTEEKIGLTEKQIESAATKTFEEVGRELQLLRQHADAESVLLLVEDCPNDPADEDAELQDRLESNKIHWNKIIEIIDEYAIKQDEKKENGEEAEDDNKDEEEEEEEDDEEAETESEEKDGDLSSGSDDDSGNSTARELKESYDDLAKTSKTINETDGACITSAQSNGSSIPSAASNQDASVKANFTDEEEVAALPGTTNNIKENHSSEIMEDSKTALTIHSMDSSEEIVILDDSSNESTEKESTNRDPCVIKEAPKDDIKGKVKVKPMSTLCRSGYSIE